VTTRTNPRRQSQRTIRRVLRTIRDSRITWAEVKATLPPVQLDNERRDERHEVRP
jgi:hypothetical protein